MEQIGRYAGSCRLVCPRTIGSKLRVDSYNKCSRLAFIMSPWPCNASCQPPNVVYHMLILSRDTPYCFLTSEPTSRSIPHTFSRSSGSRCHHYLAYHNSEASPLPTPVLNVAVGPCQAICGVMLSHGTRQGKYICNRSRPLLFFISTAVLELLDLVFLHPGLICPLKLALMMKFIIACGCSLLGLT